MPIAMPVFTAVFDRHATRVRRGDVDIRRRGAHPLAHRDGDRVDVGQVGERGDGVDARLRQVLLAELEQQLHDREQRRELARHQQRERVLLRHGRQAVGAAHGTASASAGCTTAAIATTRTNITAHASSAPPASARARYGASRLCLAKASVIAVELTSPPLAAVTAMPRPGPSQRVAM